MVILGAIFICEDDAYPEKLLSFIITIFPS